MALVGEPVVIFGHTHQPWQVQLDERLALNPGAVCGPLNGQVGAQYAILEWDGSAWNAGLRCVSYDMNIIIRAFTEDGLLDTGYLAKSFLASILSGRDVAQDFLHYAFSLSHQVGYNDLPFIPDEIWERAGASFHWDGDYA
jgi:hypothetical protein